MGLIRNYDLAKGKIDINFRVDVVEREDVVERSDVQTRTDTVSKTDCLGKIGMCSIVSNIDTNETFYDTEIYKEEGEIMSSNPLENLVSSEDNFEEIVVKSIIEILYRLEKIEKTLENLKGE